MSQIQLRILVLVTTTGKFCNFSPLLSLERAFSAHKLMENCYLNMNISFFLKNGNLIVNWFPSLFCEHSVPERLSSQFNKMKSLGLQKSQFLNIYWIGRNLKVQPTIIHKISETDSGFHVKWRTTAKSLISAFVEFFASIEEILILTVRRATRQWLYEV